MESGECTALAVMLSALIQRVKVELHVHETWVYPARGYSLHDRNFAVSLGLGPHGIRHTSTLWWKRRGEIEQEGQSFNMKYKTVP